MNFDLNDDERALQEGIRDLCAGRAPSERIRAAPTRGVDRELFGELAAPGVFGLALPEADGGLGLGATHAAVVFEELGRALVPGPVVATHLAAGRGGRGRRGHDRGRDVAATTVVLATSTGSRRGGAWSR